MSRPAGPARAITAMLVAVVLVSLADVVLTVLGWSHLAISEPSATRAARPAPLPTRRWAC